jgi:hypothetical protein
MFKEWFRYKRLTIKVNSDIFKMEAIPFYLIFYPFPILIVLLVKTSIHQQF